jgi:hypothetical protein
MELTQQDYDARKARVDKGEGDDEDARLVKHYEVQGFKATEGYDPDAVKAERTAPVDGPAVPAVEHTDSGRARTGRGKQS